MNRVNYSILFIFICVTIVSSQNKGEPLMGDLHTGRYSDVLYRGIMKICITSHTILNVSVFKSVLYLKYKEAANKGISFLIVVCNLARPSISHVRNSIFYSF